MPFSGLIVDTGDLSQIDPNYVRKASICGVPMLEHDENVVVGLRKIISYIADTFGGADLTQGDAAQIDHWMTRVETAHIEELTLATPPYPIPFPRMFSRRRLKQQIDVANRLARDVHELGDIYREHVRVLRHLFRTLGDEWKINDFYRNISVILDALELQLKTTPFAAGKAYSIADVYMTAFLARLNALGLGICWKGRPSFGLRIRPAGQEPAELCQGFRRRKRSPAVLGFVLSQDGPVARRDPGLGGPCRTVRHSAVLRFL